jgi:hypothetical protein
VFCIGGICASLICGVRSGVQTRDAIAARFDTFNENAAGEWAVKLASLGHVERLSQVIARQ